MQCGHLTQLIGRHEVTGCYTEEMNQHRYQSEGCCNLLLLWCMTEQLEQVHQVRCFYALRGNKSRLPKHCASLKKLDLDQV